MSFLAITSKEGAGGCRSNRLRHPLLSLFTNPPLPHTFERVDAVCVMTSWRRRSCDDDGIPQWDGPILQMAKRCNLSICSSLILSPVARKKAFTRSASQTALRWVSWVLLARNAGVFRCVLRPYLRGPALRSRQQQQTPRRASAEEKCFTWAVKYHLGLNPGAI